MTNRVCFKKTCFDVELAQNRSEWSYGLKNRDFLDKNKGMLFVFPWNETNGFWMKDTLIPLDIIYLDSSKEVVSISAQAQPCKSDFCPSYPPGEAYRYVLEINGGLARKFDIEVGDKAEFYIHN